MSTINTDIAILKEEAEKAQKYCLKIAEKFVEDKIFYDTNLDDGIKNSFGDVLTDILKTQYCINKQVEAGQTLNLKANAFASEMSELEDQLLSPNFEDTVKSVHLPNILNSALQNLEASESFDVSELEEFKKLQKIFDDQPEQNSQESEDLEVLPADFTIPIDPISKLEINIPARNKKCLHLYDLENLKNLIKISGKVSVKCPVSGCSNIDVRISDVEEDSRLKILIRKHKEQQEQR